MRDHVEFILLAPLSTHSMAWAHTDLVHIGLVVEVMLGLLERDHLVVGAKFLP